MTSVRRKFTEEQKMEILREANEMGISAVLRIHKLSYSAFSRWRQHYAVVITSNNHTVFDHRARSELKQYKIENIRLKKIIADQALELERREEELKKNYHLHGKK
jgi:putative transposase